VRVVRDNGCRDKHPTLHPTGVASCVLRPRVCIEMSRGQDATCSKTQNNCELHWPLEVDTWKAGGDRNAIAQRERKHSFTCIIRSEWNRFRLQ
jgi:hypothetical protein